jgi:hypothetical protein
VSLVGNWLVLTPDGKATSSSLRITADQLVLHLPCGDLIGEWTANPQGLFAAETDGGSSACFTSASGRGQEPSWLNDAVTFTVAGASHTLLDAKGHVLRKLTAGHGIIATPNVAQLRARLATAPPLPGGLFPATTKMLVGHWLPAPVRHYSLGTPAITFAADGSWSGSDGCNGQGGRWRLGPAGTLVSTAGPSTQIGCPGVPVGSWMSLARSAGFNGTTLVLVDGSGKQIGRLVRQ